MSARPLQRILYVDDEPGIRAVAKVALELVGGFTLHLCGSGQEALSVAPQFQPDLILLDIMMPGMDGPSTLAALRGIGAFAATPVIFMTAKAQPAEIKRCRALGAVEVIAKPFQAMQLAEQLRGIWNGLP